MSPQHSTAQGVGPFALSLKSIFSLIPGHLTCTVQEVDVGVEVSAIFI